MSRQLPQKPNLIKIRKQAKALLKQHKANNAEVCATLRQLQRFTDSTNEGILHAEVGLQEVQHALAKDYGFGNWVELRKAVGAPSGNQADRVKRDGGKVWIEGVSTLMTPNASNSFVQALAVAGETLGEDLSFDFLLGASGAAFRLMVHRPQWCPSAPDPTCGYDHTAQLMQATGLKLNCIQLFHDHTTDEDRKTARQQVVASIEKGFPVIAIDLKVCPEWGLIVGYEDEAEKLWCRTIFDGDHPHDYGLAANWPWILYTIEGRAEGLSQKGIVLNSFRTARELANTLAYDDYASGFAAFQAWSDDLTDDALFENMDKQGLLDLCHANWWPYFSLTFSRQGAVKYLHTVASLFNGQAAANVLKAAGTYAQIVGKLEQGAKFTVRRDELERDPNAWSRDMRHKQSAVLNEILLLEREAITHLNTILASKETTSG